MGLRDLSQSIHEMYAKGDIARLTTEIYTYHNTLSLHDALPICLLPTLYMHPHCRLRSRSIAFLQRRHDGGSPAWASTRCSSKAVIAMR